jgi:hypothetical protein
MGMAATGGFCQRGRGPCASPPASRCRWRGCCCRHARTQAAKGQAGDRAGRGGRAKAWNGACMRIREAGGAEGATGARVPGTCCVLWRGSVGGGRKDERHLTHWGARGEHLRLSWLSRERAARFGRSMRHPTPSMPLLLRRATCIIQVLWSQGQRQSQERLDPWMRQGRKVNRG